jgi:hypothetical protein
MELRQEAENIPDKVETSVGPIKKNFTNPLHVYQFANMKSIDEHASKINEIKNELVFD